jgi:hypothetical protein
MLTAMCFWVDGRCNHAMQADSNPNQSKRCSVSCDHLMLGQRLIPANQFRVDLTRSGLGWLGRCLRLFDWYANFKDGAVRRIGSR